MDSGCRAFRKHHLAFVDDTLPGIELVRMEIHVAECEACDLLDQRVRRSLLIARNYPPGLVGLSDGFAGTLSKRLAEERPQGARFPSATRVMGSPVVVSLAAVMVIVSAVAGVLGTGVGREEDAEMRGGQANMGVAPILSMSLSATPAFVSSLSTGMAILPALLLAEELPSSFAVIRATPTNGEGLSNPR